MTVVAGYDDGEWVAIASDTMGQFHDRRTTGRQKIFKVGPCFVGLAGVSAWARFLRTTTSPRAPAPGDDGWLGWCERLSDAWMAWAKERGHGMVDEGGTFLMNGGLLAATPDGLYCVDATGTVERHDLFAIGVGCEAAMGAMWGGPGDAIGLVQHGVKAANALIAGCGGGVSPAYKVQRSRPM